MKKFWILVPVIWIVFTIIGYGVGYRILHSDQLERLMKHGVGIYGTVTSKEPENHATVIYEYSVSGTNYSGRGRASDGNPKFEDIAIGERVIVFYDPDNPNESVMGYPQYQQERNTGGIYFFALVLPIFPVSQYLLILFIVYMVSKKRYPTYHL